MSSSPPETFTVRPLELSDAERALEVVGALEEAYGRRPISGIDQVLMWWERVELATESWVVEEDGRILALAWLERGGDVPEAIVVVHPRHTGRGFGRGCSTARRRGRARRVRSGSMLWRTRATSAVARCWRLEASAKCGAST